MTVTHEPTAERSQRGLPGYAVVTAGVIVAGYLVVSAVMLVVFGFSPRAGANWDHALVIYNGYTAFALAAAGVLLGTQIQQGVVNAAQSAARDAKAAERAAEAKTEAVRSVARDALAGSGGDRGGGSAETELAALRRRLLEVL